MNKALPGAISAILVLLLTFAAIETERQSARKFTHENGVVIASQQLPEELLEQGKTYLLDPIDSESALFTNKVDGYQIKIPRDMAADMRYSNIRAVLESEELKIEIYRQEINEEAGYINYSNQFIKNSIDHKKELEGMTEAAGRDVYYLQWSRKPLARVANDRCYYASVDIPLSDKEIITFFFKSSGPFESQSYLEVVKSLELCEITALPYTRKIKRTDNSEWDSATAEVYEEFFGNYGGFSWGIFEAAAPVNFDELKKIEDRVDFTFPILLYYTGVLENKENHPNLNAALINAKAEGRLLELTLQTGAQLPGKGNMIYDVLDGDYDTYLKNYAKTVATSEAPILFRLCNEMNGDWCTYSAWHTAKDTDIFKAFWRYVYQIFRKAGADNVIWIWNPNGRSFPDFKWNDELCYYPGDEYVDVVGMTGYNTGIYYRGEIWQEFNEIYDSLYEKYTDLSEKPLMITEFASSSVGGSKEAWVANMFRHIQKYERIRAAVWWDGCDWDASGNVARPYFIDETEGLVSLFRENLKDFR